MGDPEPKITDKNHKTEFVVYKILVLTKFQPEISST